MKTIQLPYNWRPREYQLPVWRYFESDAPRKRAVCIWHRRAGKDTVAINLIATQLYKRVGVYWHVFPEHKQARHAIWNGVNYEGRRYMDYFPPGLIVNKSEADMRLDFENGSSYYLVGSDNYNSLVGTNPVGVVFSEYSLQDPAAWQYIMPILTENGGWALFIYTLRRDRRHGIALWRRAEKNGWFVDIRHAGSGPNGTRREDGTPVVSDEQIEQDRRDGMPEEVIQTEYFNNINVPATGAYYATQMDMARKDNRITNVPWEPALPVDTAWDLGMGDLTVILFIQRVNREIRFIDMLYSSDEGLAFYKKKLDEKPYHYGEHFAPWDIGIREMGTGRSRMDVARSMGLRFTVTHQKLTAEPVKDGIELVRNMLPRCWFDKTRCALLVEALCSYRKEEEKLKSQFTGDEDIDVPITIYKDKPLKSWETHFADAVRTLAWHTEHRRTTQVAMLQRRALDDFSYV